jgi:hypothetical protein
LSTPSQPRADFTVIDGALEVINKEITSIEIPPGVISLSPNGFCDCHKLLEVLLPEEIK